MPLSWNEIKDCAAKNARERSRRTNTPFIVYENGRIVDLNAKRATKARRK